MDLGYAEKERECQRFSECGLRGVIYELGELNYKLKYGKVTRITEILEGLVYVCGADVIILL